MALHWLGYYIAKYDLFFEGRDSLDGFEEAAALWTMYGNGRELWDEP